MAFPRIARAARERVMSIEELVLILSRPGAFDDDRLSRGSMHAVVESTGASAAWLYRVHEDLLLLAGAAGLPEELVASIASVPMTDASIAAQAAASGRAARGDHETSSPSDRAVLERAGGGALLGLPLRVNGQRVGVLVLASKAEASLPPEQRMEAVASVVAMAIASLHERAPASEHVVGTMHRVVEKLLDHVARDPAERGVLFAAEASFDEREFLALLLEGARKLTGAEIGAVGVGVDPTRPFDPWVVDGITEQVAARIGTHPRPVATLGAVAVGGETLRVHEVSEHPAFVGLPRHHPPVHSLLAVPIRIREKSFGNVYLANKSGGDFTDADQDVMELLGALAALGLNFVDLATKGQEREMFLQLLASTPDGILYVDKPTGHILVSKALERSYGLTIDPRRGVAQEIGHLCWPNGAPLTLADLPSTRALAGETVHDVELMIKRSDGTSIPILQRAVPFIERGEVRGAIVSFRDLSPVKEAERIREEFAAMVVHDLRNPIQSMLLQVQMLRAANDEGRPVASTSWDRLVRSARRLAQMATDMLDSTRIELARIALHRAATSPEGAVRYVVDNVRSVLSHHSIVIDAAPGLPFVMIDVVRFDQILTNLLENAAKHSAEGTTIHIGLRASSGGVEISVRDEGVGISPDELPHLFDRFYQVKRAREHRTGLGLGLHIAKGLTEAHGGQMTAESVVDRGSTFRIWLPGAEAEPSHVSPVNH